VVLVNGKPEHHHHPEGSCYLEWRDGAKRARLSLGTNAVDAHARLLRKEAELNAVNNGCHGGEGSEGRYAFAGGCRGGIPCGCEAHAQAPKFRGGSGFHISLFLPTVHGFINVVLRISATADEIQVSRLFNWPRTCDEDVHESPRALLPIRAGRHMGDADQRPE